MRIAILGPTHKSFIHPFLVNYPINELPEGYYGAPFLGVLIKELLSRGHEVIAITTSPVSGEDYSVKSFEGKSFRWYVVPARRNAFFLNGKKLGRIVDFFSHERQKMSYVIQNELPDFVHAHWTYEFAGALKNCTIPHLVTIHDNPYQVLRFLPGVYRFFRLLMSEWVLKGIRYVSTVSPYMKEYSESKCSSVRIIPNPVAISSNIEEIRHRASMKISAGVIKAIMVMNGWDARKNGIAGLKAFALLKQRFPNAQLSLFGKGTEQMGAAFESAKSMGLSDVVFNGPVDHDVLIENIKESWILIHPSLEESFGLVLIEAMSNGVPVIGGNRSGAVPWVVGNPACLVDLSDAKNIFYRLVELFSAPALYEEVVNSGFLNCVKRFSVDAVVSEYESYYKDIIKSW